MNIEIGLGVVGANDTAWGSTAEGLPVLLIRTAAATVRIVFQPEEAKEHGIAALYLAVDAVLKAGGMGAAKPASRLVGPDGGPVQ